MKSVIFSFMLIFLWGTAVTAQFSTKIFANDAASFDDFGNAVDISRNQAIVGSPLDDDLTFSTGSVYFFENAGGVWQQTAKRIASDGKQNDSFGRSVAIWGNYAVVGSPFNDDGGSDAGAIYIFKNTDAGWLQTDKIFSKNPKDNARFGIKVSIWRNLIIVGANNETNDNGSAAGAVYVFERKGDKWDNGTTLIAGDGSEFDNFGNDVDIFEDFAVIGASGVDDNGASSGAAYIFKHHSDGGWKQKYKLIANDGFIFDSFGTSVAINQRRVIVGATGDDDNGDASGSAYLFQLRESDCALMSKITAFDGAPFANFGFDVDIFADRILVGAYRQTINSIRSGAIYYYRLNDRGEPILQKQILDSSPSNSSFFGLSVAIGERFITTGISRAFNPSIANTTGAILIADCDYNAPIISKGLDVPNDEGGFVSLEWQASLIDNSAHELGFYSIWRALPTSLAAKQSFSKEEIHVITMETKIRTAQINGVVFAFEKIGMQDAHFLRDYSFTAQTLFDQTSTTSGDHLFMVSYHTSNPSIFYDSEAITAFSVDNISPSPLTNLSATIISDGVELTWEESENVDLSYYKLYRGNEAGNLVPYVETKEAYYMDQNVESEQLYFYSVAGVDSSGNEGEMAAADSVTITVTAIKDISQTPQSFKLEQNYPNPFNPMTTITVHVADSRDIKLVIYDAHGREIETLVNGLYSAGVYNISWDASNLASGIYFISMQTKNFSAIRKSILIK